MRTTRFAASGKHNLTGLTILLRLVGSSRPLRRDWFRAPADNALRSDGWAQRVGHRQGTRDEDGLSHLDSSSVSIGPR